MLVTAISFELKRFLTLESLDSDVHIECLGLPVAA